jgi:hypothetical protein
MTEGQEMPNNEMTIDQQIDKRKATLCGYHIYLPHDTIDKEALNELIYFTRKRSGHIQALYDRAEPKDITNTNLNKNTFKALHSIPAEY